MTAEQRLKFLTNLMIDVRLGKLGPLPAAEQVDRMMMDLMHEYLQVGANLASGRPPFEGIERRAQ